MKAAGLILLVLGVVLLMIGGLAAIGSQLELVRTCSDKTGTYYMEIGGLVTDKSTGLGLGSVSILMFNAGHVEPYSQIYHSTTSTATGDYVMDYRTAPGDGGLRMEVDAMRVGFDTGKVFVTMPCPEDFAAGGTYPPGTGSTAGLPYSITVDFALLKASPLKAAFTWASSGATSATFYDSSSGGPNSWTWTFGDSTPAVTTTQPSISHTWATSGTYGVSMTAKRSSDGATSSATATIQIGGGGTQGGTSTPGPTQSGSSGNTTQANNGTVTTTKVVFMPSDLSIGILIAGIVVVIVAVAISKA